jgi:hypothetical protein
MECSTRFLAETGLHLDEEVFVENRSGRDRK